MRRDSVSSKDAERLQMSDIYSLRWGNSDKFFTNDFKLEAMNWKESINRKWFIVKEMYFDCV